MAADKAQGSWKVQIVGTCHTHKGVSGLFPRELWLLSRMCQAGKPLETLPPYILSKPLQTTVLIVHIYEILPFLWELSVKK